MEEITFKIIFMVLYVLGAIVRAPFAYKVKKMKVKFSRRKVYEYIVMVPVALGLMIVPLVHVFSSALDGYNMFLPTWVRVIGVVGFFFGFLVYSWSHIALTTNWSPVLEIKEKQKLITSGPYKYVRHPMYTGFWLWSVFQGILLSNWAVLVLGILSFGLMYFSRIKHEEKLMIEGFGNSYKEYMKKTGRILPKF